MRPQESAWGSAEAKTEARPGPKSEPGAAEATGDLFSSTRSSPDRRRRGGGDRQRWGRDIPTVDPKTFCGPAAADGAGPVDSALGMYQSLDGGKTWNRVLDGLVDSFVIDPQDSNVVYAALDTGGIYRSGDRGKTWTKSLSLAPLLIIGPRRPESTLFELDPQDSKIADVSTEGGLYRSADSGKTWTRTLEGEWDQIVFNLVSPSVVYARGRTQTSPPEQHSDAGLTVADPRRHLHRRQA